MAAASVHCREEQLRSTGHLLKDGRKGYDWQLFSIPDVQGLAGAQRIRGRARRMGAYFLMSYVHLTKNMPVNDAERDRGE